MQLSFLECALIHSEINWENDRIFARHNRIRVHTFFINVQIPTRKCSIKQPTWADVEVMMRCDVLSFIGFIDKIGKIFVHIRN